MKSKSQITKFIDLIDTRKEISNNYILPQEFWQAFEQGIYPSSNQDLLSYHIDEYARLIGDLCYVHSIYSFGYEINFIVIKDIFFISIFSLSDQARLIGIVDFNKGRKKHEICYSAKSIDNHPIVTYLLNKLSDELSQKGLNINERISGNYILPFHTPLKSIVCTLKWKQLMINEPDLTPEVHADRIAKQLKINPITLAGTYGKSSIDTEVKKEAFIAYNHLLDSKYSLTEQWQELLLSSPELTAKERAEHIATRVDLDPVTVAAYLKYTLVEKVRSEAHAAYTRLLEAKHDITAQWLELLTEAPDLSPRERAEMIAIRQGIDPVTIAGYGRVSKNKKVKNEARKAFNNLLDSKHEITKQWRELLSNSPELSPKERAEKIAAKLKANPSSVASYGKSSLDTVVRYEASQAFTMLMEAKHNITSQWLNLLKTMPNSSMEQRVTALAKKLGLDPVTVAGYGRASPNSKVKSEAFKVITVLLDSKYEITAKWRKFIDNYPEKSPRERAECIASELGLNATSVASYGRSSKDKLVKYEATKAFSAIFESRYEITQKWKNLINSSPHLSPQERAQTLASDLKIGPISIAGYARSSSDPSVKTEAIKAFSKLMESKYGITNRWLISMESMPHYTNQERAEHLAVDLGLEPITVANLGRYSDNPLVKSKADHAFRALRDSMLEVTKNWQESLKTKPNLNLIERVESLANLVGNSPITVAGVGMTSPDKTVRYEAKKAFSILLEAKHEITKRWHILLKNNPPLTPSQIAQHIAQDLGLAPLTVASYGAYSTNPHVSSAARHAVYTSHKLKQNSSKK